MISTTRLWRRVNWRLHERYPTTALARIWLIQPPRPDDPGDWYIRFARQAAGNRVIEKLCRTGFDFDEQRMSHTDRYKEIQLPQLRSFCVSAAAGNFTAAARTLGISTPTVWQQVRALEKHLKTTLLRRRGRSIELTDEGRVLLDIVQPHVSGLDSLESMFAARQHDLPPELTVSTTPYLASSYLLKPIRAFTVERPTLRLKFGVHVWTRQVIELIEQGQADVGVVLHDRNEPRSAQTDYEYLVDLPFCLITPANHPLANKRTIKPTDWASYPLVVPSEGSYARKILNQLIVRHDLTRQVRVVMETELLDNIQQYVSVGLGISLVHLGERLYPGAKLHVRPLVEEADPFVVSVVTRHGAHLSQTVQEFRETLRLFLAGSRTTRRET